MPLRTEPHPRHKIKQLSKQLRKLSFPTSPISVDLARFAADAFDRFLTGQARTLNEAFGLTRKRGVPGWPKVRLKMAKEIYELRKNRTSWSKIQEYLASRYTDTDLGTLKRTYKEFRVHLMSKSVVNLLKSDPS
jgi:hypothetical protein